ncbi:Hypothetical predicted protein [Pelobates cultripes]|uniref:Uncharacterized protein n=1 Tax=Pelobates cultripes TaxID=61616 RepID=A0AAD1R030_PELCU|nr:Hypothetical predicted protein [Pelobates cultripes]
MSNVPDHGVPTTDSEDKESWTRSRSAQIARPSLAVVSIRVQWCKHITPESGACQSGILNVAASSSLEKGCGNLKEIAL